MPSRTLGLGISLVTLLAIGLWPASAQESEQPKGGFSSMLNVDAMVDNYARLLARKYDLTEDQDAFTQQFLREKCHEFLDKHRDELYALVDRMFEVRGGAEIDQQEMMNWGRQAAPLFQEAKRLIVEGNAEWRQILTEEQRRVHDEDLKLMYDSFATTEDQLQRIVSGQMTVDEFRRGNPGGPPARESSPVPPPAPAERASSGTGAVQPHRVEGPAATATTGSGAAPRRGVTTGRRPAERIGRSGGAVQPARGDRSGAARNRGGGPTPLKAGPEFEGQWEAYVREFIQRYQLDEAQSQKAMSILKDCQEQARSHMAKRKHELEALENRAKALANKPDSAKESAEVNQQRQKLLEPIGAIFERQLKPRLERIPTRAQRQAAESAPRGGSPDKAQRGRQPEPPPPQPEPVPPPPSEPEQPPEPEPEKD